MEILAKLFSSEPLVKVMRLFLMNPTEGFEKKDIEDKCRIKSDAAMVEIKLLSSIDFIEKRDGYKQVETVVEKDGEEHIEYTKKKFKGWFLNPRFNYLKPLRSLLIENEVVNKPEIASRFRGVGKVKLLVASGVFIDENDTRLDLLVVGDHLNTKKIENAVAVLGSEIGRDLSYAVFEVDEFKYRLSMYDKLICDIFDFKHVPIIESPMLSTEMIRTRR